ncbi:MAG: cell division/cell wall cluster transcriptional repressor MraZ [Candidatus Daviesbacteria bacterium]|nr:cell division/cell wall cluster transcriptional repressor MraZ [Candidatus Daviesbacteria bacterium]
MFLGEHFLQFSGQGRIILPAKIRDNLETVILVRGLDGCIWGFSESFWQEESDKYLKVPLTEVEGRNMRRYIFSAAEKVVLDNQGRFVIPLPLVSHANLKGQVAVIGAGDHFEIWDVGAWKKVKKRLLNEELFKIS